MFFTVFCSDEKKQKKTKKKPPKRDTKRMPINMQVLKTMNCIDTSCLVLISVRY